MANTYTQIYIQLVFAVSAKSPLINESFKDELERYIGGITKNIACPLYAIYCNPDHVHLLIGINKTLSISEVAKIIKSKSSKFINEHKKTKCHFNWQVGYGAFSYSQSQIEIVKQYILNQKKHHETKTFKEEYINMLQKFNIEYDDRYLFDFTVNKNSR